MAQTEMTAGEATKKLFALLKLDRKDVSAVYVFAILAGLVQLVMPLGIQAIINFVLANQISTSIIILIAMVVLAVFISGLLQVRQLQIIEKIQQKIFVRYSFEFADRLLKLNVEKLDKYYLPEVVNRFFDTQTLQKALEKLLLEVPIAIIQICFGLLLLSFYHPVFIAFGLILILIIFIIIKYTSPKGFSSSVKASDYKYATAAWLEELARVIKSFKYSRGTNLHMKRTDAVVEGYLQSRTTHFKILLTQYWTLISFKLFITATMLIVGAILLVDQQINIGQFIAAEIVILMIIASVEKLITNLDKVYDVLTSVIKLSKIIDSEIEESGTAKLEKSNKGVSVRFKDVNFGYGNNELVLNNINLQIQSGQKVCIMGESGSGKSTILRLLTGAFKNFNGSILIDEIPIGNYSLTSLRSATGILLSQQDIFLGTLLENITMGNEEIINSDITDLAARCGLNDFIQSHAQGFDTMLDPTGKRLPSKVREDILLMRALLGHRRLVLLEEPFNHLEKHYQNSVLDYLKKDEHSTVLITTVDSSIAAQCDYIMYVKNGQVLYNGTWNEIKNKIEG